MKSRRELLAALFIDLAKALIISLAIGKIVSAISVSWLIVGSCLLIAVFLIFCAVLLQPSTAIDKEFGI